MTLPPPISLLAQFDWITTNESWIQDLTIAILALAMLAVIIWMLRPALAGTSADFTIHVDDETVSYSGNFPPHMQSTVTDFLLHDCQIPGSYQIKGHWDEGRLIIAVRGESARPLEQRIRNFLKLNLKPPAKRPF